MGGPQIRIMRLASYPIAGIETTVLLPRRNSSVLRENLEKEGDWSDTLAKTLGHRYWGTRPALL